VVAGLTKAISGTQATGNTGSLAVVVTKALSGIQASGAVGTVTVSGLATTVRVSWG
jgi:hypothetical protein